MPSQRASTPGSSDAALAGTALQLQGLATAWLSQHVSPRRRAPVSHPAARSSSCPPGREAAPRSASDDSTGAASKRGRAVTFNLRVRRPGPAYSSPGEADAQSKSPGQHSGVGGPQPMIAMHGNPADEFLAHSRQQSEASRTLRAAAGTPPWGLRTGGMQSGVQQMAQGSSPEPQPARYPGIMPSQMAAAANTRNSTDNQQPASVHEVLAGDSPSLVIPVERQPGGGAALPHVLDLMAASRLQLAMECAASPAKLASTVNLTAPVAVASSVTSGSTLTMSPMNGSAGPSLPPQWSPVRGVHTQLSGAGSPAVAATAQPWQHGMLSTSHSPLRSHPPAEAPATQPAMPPASQRASLLQGHPAPPHPAAGTWQASAPPAQTARPISGQPLPNYNYLQQVLPLPSAFMQWSPGGALPPPPLLPTPAVWPSTLSGMLHNPPPSAQPLSANMARDTLSRDGRGTDAAPFASGHSSGIQSAHASAARGGGSAVRPVPTQPQQGTVSDLVSKATGDQSLSAAFAQRAVKLGPGQGQGQGQGQEPGYAQLQGQQGQGQSESHQERQAGFAGQWRQSPQQLHASDVQAASDQQPDLEQAGQARQSDQPPGSATFDQTPVPSFDTVHQMLSTLSLLGRTVAASQGAVGTPEGSSSALTHEQYRSPTARRHQQAAPWGHPPSTSAKNHTGTPQPSPARWPSGQPRGPATSVSPTYGMPGGMSPGLNAPAAVLLPPTHPGASASQQVQQADGGSAARRWAVKGLPLAAAFAALGIDGDDCDSQDGRRMPPLEPDPSGAFAPAALVAASRELPVRLVKLLAVRAVAAAARRSAADSWHEASERLAQVSREASLAAAYEMALRLGIPKARLRRFRRYGVTGVTNVVLGPLQDRCRALLVLRVMRAKALWRQDLTALLAQAASMTAPAMIGALFAAWRSVTSLKAQRKSKMAWLTQKRSKVVRQQCFVAWSEWALWKADARRRVADARAQAAVRARATVLVAWQGAAKHAGWRRACLEQAADKHLRKVLQGWQGAAADRAHRKSLKAKAAAHRLRSLVQSALAHWRLLQLRTWVRRQWNEAIEGWHAVRLKGRALKLWHAQASRVAAIVARAAAQRTGQAPVHVARSLSGGGAAAAQLLSSTSAAVQPVLDEMQHLRRYCRLSAQDQADEDSRRLPCDDATWEQFQQAGEASGSRLLLGQWQHKDQVSHLLAHKLALESQKAADEARLSQAESNYRAAAAECAAQQEQLQQRCSELQRELDVLQDTGQQLETQEKLLMEELDAASQQLQLGLEQQRQAASDVELKADRLSAAELREAEARCTASASEARSHAAAQAADEAVQQVTAAERSAAGALASDMRARERLLAEQQRLSETLSLCSALFQHLQELERSPRPADPVAADEAQQAIAVTAANYQEARSLGGLVQAEAEHQAASAAALAAANAEAQRSLARAHQLASECASEASAAAQVSQLAGAAHSSAAMQAAQAAQQLAAARVEVQRTWALVEETEGQVQARRQAVGEVRQRRAELAVRLVAMRDALARADAQFQQVRNEADAGEALFRQKQLELQPGVLRAQVLLLQLHAELDRFPSGLVRVLESELQAGGVGGGHQGLPRQRSPGVRHAVQTPSLMRVPWASPPARSGAGSGNPAWLQNPERTMPPSPGRVGEGGHAWHPISLLTGAAAGSGKGAQALWASPSGASQQGQVVCLSQLMAASPQLSPKHSYSVSAEPASVDRASPTKLRMRNAAASPAGGKPASPSAGQDAAERGLRGWLSPRALQKAWRAQKRLPRSESASPQGRRDGDAGRPVSPSRWQGMGGSGTWAEQWESSLGLVAQPEPGAEPWVPPGPPDAGLLGNGVSHHRNASPPNARSRSPPVGRPLPSMAAAASAALKPRVQPLSQAAPSLVPEGRAQMRGTASGGAAPTARQPASDGFAFAEVLPRSRSRSPLTGRQLQQQPLQRPISRNSSLPQPGARREPGPGLRQRTVTYGGTGAASRPPHAADPVRQATGESSVSLGGGVLHGPGATPGESSPGSSITLSLGDLSSLQARLQGQRSVPAVQHVTLGHVHDTFPPPDLGANRNNWAGLAATAAGGAHGFKGAAAAADTDPAAHGLSGTMYDKPQPRLRSQLSWPVPGAVVVPVQPREAWAQKDQGPASSSGSSFEAWPRNLGANAAKLQQKQQHAAQGSAGSRQGGKDTGQRASAHSGVAAMTGALRPANVAPTCDPSGRGQVSEHLNAKAPTAVAAMMRGMRGGGGSLQAAPGAGDGCSVPPIQGVEEHTGGRNTGRGSAVGAWLQGWSEVSAGSELPMGPTSEREAGDSKLEAAMTERYWRRVAERVLQRLAAEVVVAREAGNLACMHARSQRSRRTLLGWKGNVQSLVSEARKIASATLLRRSLVEWRCWAQVQLQWAELVKNHRIKRNSHLQRRVMSAWRQWKARKLYCQRCIDDCARRRLHQRWALWRGLVQARQLLVRVFMRAEQLWEVYCTAPVYGEDFQLLSKALQRWRQRTKEKGEKRRLRAAEQAAEAFRRTRLQVAAFGALTRAVSDAWQSWRLRRTARLLLQRWQQRAEAKRDAGVGLGTVRRRLRVQGVASESRAYQLHLLSKAFWSWAGPLVVALDHASRALLRRCWAGWHQRTVGCLPRATLAAVARHSAARVMKAWGMAVTARRAMQGREQAAGQWRLQQLLWKALQALHQHLTRRRALLDRVQTAFLQRRSILLRKAFTALQGSWLAEKRKQRQQQQQQQPRPRTSPNKQLGQMVQQPTRVRAVVKGGSMHQQGVANSAPHQGRAVNKKADVAKPAPLAAMRGDDRLIKPTNQRPAPLHEQGAMQPSSIRAHAPLHGPPLIPASEAFAFRMQTALPREQEPLTGMQQPLNAVQGHAAHIWASTEADSSAIVSLADLCAPSASAAAFAAALSWPAPSSEMSVNQA